MITPVRKRIFANFFSLSLLETLNYIFPLITLPYLVRILGPAKYGAVAFAQALMQIFVILTDYGFYLAAPKKIAVSRNNPEKIRCIFWTIMFIKFIFLLLSFTIILIMIFSIQKFHDHLWLYIFSFGYVLSDYMLPMWFFQGMEKMKYITFLYFIAKSIFTAAVFILIKSSQNYILVPALNSLGMILSGIVGLFIIKNVFRVTFYIPSLSTIIHEIKEGWYYFVSTLSISINTYAGIFILGLLTNDTIVGYYSAAERLIRAIQRILWAISQSVYPYMNKLAAESRERALILLRKMVFFIGGGFLIVSIIILINAKLIVNAILGAQYSASVSVLSILSILPFILTISNIYGIQTMIPFDMKKPYSMIMIMTAGVNVFGSLFMTHYFKHIGLSITVLFTEIFSILLMFFYLRNKKINILQKISVAK